MTTHTLTEEQTLAAQRKARIALLRKIGSTLTTYGLMTILAILFLFPIVFMIVAAFKKEANIRTDLTSLWAFVPNPDTVTLENMQNMLDRIPFEQFATTSIIITFLSVIGGLFINSMAAFSLARLRWFGRSAILYIIVSLVIIPLEAIAVPLMIQVSDVSPFLNVFLLALLGGVMALLWSILWSAGDAILNRYGVDLPKAANYIVRGIFTLALAFPIELTVYYLFKQSTQESAWREIAPRWLMDNVGFTADYPFMFVMTVTLGAATILLWRYSWERLAEIVKTNQATSNLSPAMKNIVHAVAATIIALPLELLFVYLFSEMQGSVQSWFNTYHVMIVPFLADPFSIFLFYQFFIGIPKDFDEAATVDGASHFRIYWDIAVPLTRPVFATVAILQFLRFWSFFMWPLLVTQGTEFAPLMVGMGFLRQGNEQTLGQEMGYAALVTIPVLIFFLVFQGWFVRSVSSSGVKG
jgi:ABC-type glycerol-3-phosphate transport system permease component